MLIYFFIGGNNFKDVRGIGIDIFIVVFYFFLKDVNNIDVIRLIVCSV